MTERRPRLLYLSIAFPPKFLWVFRPSHVTTSESDIQMLRALSGHLDISTVGLLPAKLHGHWNGEMEEVSGLGHELALWDKNPALWHRWISWRKLRRYYLAKVRREGMPDVIVVRNLQHVYNHFVRWLRRQPRRPPVVLMLGDSGGLGEKISPLRRLRYKLKPMQTLDQESVLMYDACIGSGLKSREYFEQRNVPWTWIPMAFPSAYQPPPPNPNETGPIRFGYFGALSEHSAVLRLVQTFLKANTPGSLHVCGHGSAATELAKLAERHPNFHFDGFLPQPSDCLAWAQKVDVLVNVRLPYWGQENSVPSKVFDYAAAGKAVLSTRTAGMDEILGPDGFYIEAEGFEDSLRQKLQEISAINRLELQRRAQAIRNRIVGAYNCEEQARRIADFLTAVTESHSAGRR